MYVHLLIDDARKAIADNPYKIDTTRLSHALDRLNGRREALAEMQRRVEAVAAGLVDAIFEPLNPVPGLAFEDEHFSKGTLACLLGNLRNSVHEVQQEIDSLDRLKAAHRETLRQWREAA